MIPLLPVLGLLGVYAAKKIYDSFSSDSDDDNFDNSEAKARARERVRRQTDHNSSLIAGELLHVSKQYLGSFAMPTRFDQQAMDAFLNSDCEDRAEAEKALSVLCGKQIRMPSQAGRQQSIRQQMDALEQLEQLINEM